MPLKILFIGDVVGSPGRKIVAQVLPRIIPRWNIGLVVCNAENAAGGSGLTINCHEELVDAGVDVFTLGDHAYRKDEVFTLFDRDDRLCRPANYPEDSPGAEWAVVEARDGTKVGVFTLLGRTYMRPVDDPFRAADRVLERMKSLAKVVLLDIHAEATSDKQLLGRYLDGRVSAAVGGGMGAGGRATLRPPRNRWHLDRVRNWPTAPAHLRGSVATPTAGSKAPSHVWLETRGNHETDDDTRSKRRTA